MGPKKIVQETIQEFCNRQISISLKSAVAVNNPVVKPLKRLVGFSTYDGTGYSKYEDPNWIEDFNKMNEKHKNTFSDIVKKQEELICQKLISNRDKALEELVRTRLYNLNYKFTKDESFYNFIRDRLTKIDDENNNGYIYLDYISEADKGVLLVTFSNKIDYDFDSFFGKITMSIG